MEFQFNIDLTAKDYIDFNIFWQTKSRYGKKMLIIFRIILLVLLSLPTLSAIRDIGFSAESIISGILLIIIPQLILMPFLKLAAKIQIKALIKNGKPPYSPHSVLTFYEDCLTEETEDIKTEIKYSGIDRISIVENKLIMIHTNSVQAYLLPAICFGSDIKYNLFKEFIKTKCAAVDTYK